MIPIRDEIPTKRMPIINYALIIINILVFIFQLQSSDGGEAAIFNFALIPSQVTSGIDIGDIRDIFTSMFMHGGIMHIAGNMLYLWIFGDNIEDAMGRRRYLFFYLLGGFTASLAHIITNPGSTIPTVGASGAIAAVLGAYLVLYPRSRVLTIIPLGVFLRMTMVPAVFVLGLWFVLQLLPGILALGGPDVGGVAYWAHIGGFVVGIVFGRIFAKQAQYQKLPRW